MVDISQNSALFRLVDRLERTQVLTDLELSYEDILDSLWLASYLETNESNTGNEKSPEQNQQQAPIPIIDRPEAESNPEDISNQEDPHPKADLYTEESLETEPSTSPHTEGLPFKVPAAPAIQNSLQISRAIRPLMRKVPSRTKTILDEEATVTRIAERDVWLPVTKPKPERWLDLELIVENSRSTFIWQETINELQQILENHGAFRNVRVWDLATPDKSQLKLARRTKRGETNRYYSHRELIQSNGRSLILLISDCVSSIWQQGLIYPWLQQWSQKQPTALMQLFPEWLWDSTQLGIGRKLFARAIVPGLANSQLTLSNLPAWLPINWKKTLVLPVLNLEPEVLKQWSRVVAGSGKARISTYLFDLEFIKERVSAHNNSHEQAVIDSSSEVSQKEQAEILVKKFLASASITAQKLAGMMAAAPVSMSVVNLIRKTLLKEATPVHVAEVYMSGLLQTVVETNESPTRVYDFLPDVREVLNQAIGEDTTVDVLDTISRYIAEEIDRPIRSFTALLVLMPQFSEREQEQIMPFAQIAVEVLQNLGGEYAELATELKQTSLLAKPVYQADLTGFPPIQVFTFAVATIEIKLEFKVVTLVRKEQVSNRPKPEKLYFKEDQFDSEFPESPLYQSYTELSQNEEEGIDYCITSRQNDSDVAIIAIHGGRIQLGTTEIVDLIAGNDYNFYSFEGIKENDENDTLYIPSYDFDEPKALEIVGRSNRVIAIYGFVEKSEFISLGGLDNKLKERIQEYLVNAGFAETRNSTNFFKSQKNICNRSKTGKGVQIGISWGLRKKLFASLQSENNEPTLFDRFVQAIRDALSPLEAAGWRYQTTQGEAKYYTEELGNGVELDMISIPGGSFMMGSPEGEGDSSERPQHQVAIQPFFMGKFQVTQAQWQAVMGNNPARFTDNLLNPVEQVSWEDAVEFCSRLSQLTGKEYRLPTEAEWEYACRAGTKTPFHFGETISTDLANYYGEEIYGEGIKGEYREQTTPVGYFKVANNFGLYDMHGNVWEWCEDDYEDNYNSAPTDGSAWLSKKSSYKVIRGGSWLDLPAYCRSAFRIGSARDNRFDDIGFRVVCVAGRTT